MDIEKIWKAHQPPTHGLPDLHQAMQAVSSKGQSPLKRMKRMLKINIIWAIVIAVAYVVLIFLFRDWQIHLFIGIALVFTAWGAFSAANLYKRVNDEVTAGNLLQELQRNSQALKSWLRLQIRVAIGVYPFCVIGGFLLGGVIGSGKSVDVLLHRPLMIIYLIAAIILFTPIGYWLTKWMFRQSFEKVVQQLDNHIQQLTDAEDY